MIYMQFDIFPLLSRKISHFLSFIINIWIIVKYVIKIEHHNL